MNILGVATISSEVAEWWAAKNNATPYFIGLASVYWRLAPLHGVNPEVAYAQAAHETAFGRFGGVIPGPEFHNWCGLRTTNIVEKPPYDHAQFPTDEVGITAHLDHLALYAGAPGYPKLFSSTKGSPVATPDPRHFYTIYGHAETVEQLGGNWAPASSYGTMVLDKVNEMLAEAN